MTEKVLHLANALNPIIELHRQIEELATHASTAYIRSAPIRVEDRNGWPCHIWYESPALRIVSIDGSVGIEPGERFDYFPDTTFLTGRNQAREIAQALLSGSAYVAEHPPADQKEDANVGH
ncbi:Uncharacterised protein [Mycobacteroides abscessus subsp. abscessus]|uniref:hypothetical protein n=1 Tax=Mycobacteroides abscessus TaxID=36809 RepID=UPI00092A18CA|nr:hypothetical protein [Mycobacteroides abscessus]SHU68752.1 Uncharacterised protein [Mycobacteroides abscessus subsp. abscessus]